VHEELTNTLQTTFLEYVKGFLEPTENKRDMSGQGSKRGKRDMETRDGFPVMPEVNDSDRKEDLEDLLRRYLTAQYSEWLPTVPLFPTSGLNIKHHQN
jgi:hypothetical protein